ncbi:MAG: hypothetical protein QNJ35_00020 [Paracoccaceae bacterium]|nr:hypothetical protein [Paracoccaceae bacterium]
MKRILTLLIAGLLATPVAADNDRAVFLFGSDVFAAGRDLTHESAGAEDLFMAGEVLVGETDISGTAYLAGREIRLEGGVGGDIIVLGEEIEVQGDVAGDIIAAGRAISVADVGGDVRLAGAELELSGDIAGYAMLAGEEIDFDGAVSGDVSLAAGEVDWGRGATIGGRLILYEEEPGDISVPDRVIPEDRIERREIEEWEGPEPPSLRSIFARFMFGVIVVAALAALIAALAPERLAEMRRMALDRPFRALWLGFLTQSAVIGAGLLFAMTIIGLLLTPAMIILALAGGFAGYVVASYAFGVGLLMMFGQGEPESLQHRAVAAGVGALAAGLIGAIPFLGWLFVLALVLTGIGAITMRVVRPAFFADPDHRGAA